MHSRVAIIGNAGSGKSYLAAALAKAWVLPIVDLDALFWMPGGYTVKRPTEAVLEKRWLKTRDEVAGFVLTI